MGWQAMADKFWNSATRTSLAETNQVTFPGLLRQQFVSLIDVRCPSYDINTYIIMFRLDNGIAQRDTAWYTLNPFQRFMFNKLAEAWI